MFYFKEFYFFLLIILLLNGLLNGCYKNITTLTQSQKDILILENSDIYINVEYQTKENIALHEINAKDDITILPDYSGMIIEEFLVDFFQEKNYILFEEPLDVNNRNIYFAVHYILDTPKVFDMATGFEIIDNIVFPYFFIKDFKFIDKNNSIFSDFSKGYNSIYGFNFSYSYPRPPSTIMPGLNIKTFFDNGMREADMFNLVWNEENKTFEHLRWF